MKRPVFLTLLLPLLLLAACHEQQLLSNLSEQQANEVVAVLQAHDVSINKQDLGKSGFAVSVGQDDFPAAVDLLKIYNLPARARVEISEAFPADALVASPQAEEARLLSAVEQRLEQNLAAMGNIASARVQLSYPMHQETGGKSEEPMHVAVLLTYRNAINHDLLVSEIKRFVKNSFSNIDYDNISVILHQAPPVFRTRATEPAATEHATWPYWLLVIPALLATLATGAHVYLRRRHAPLVQTTRVRTHTANRDANGAQDNRRADGGAA